MTAADLLNVSVPGALLSDTDLIAALDAGDLSVVPGWRDAVQPASIDLRLGRQFRTFNNHGHTHIDPAADQPGLTELVEVGVPAADPDGPARDHPRTQFVLHPGEFVLGTTYETVRIPPHLAARIEGKSSLGRLGLLVHSTAGFIDPGFSGLITLELSNVASLPIILRPGMPIAQLCVMRLTSPARRPYGHPGLNSKYQGQDTPTASRFHRNGLAHRLR